MTKAEADERARKFFKCPGKKHPHSSYCYRNTTVSADNDVQNGCSRLSELLLTVIVEHEMKKPPSEELE